MDGPTDPERHTEDEDNPQASRRKTKTRRRRNKQREERYGAAVISEDGEGRLAPAGMGDAAEDDDVSNADAQGTSRLKFTVCTVSSKG